jgi:hypothetical protein
MVLDLLKNGSFLQPERDSENTNAVGPSERANGEPNTLFVLL